MVKQLSVFMENKPGRLAEITDLLGKNGINIRGFSVADMSDYGIFRLIVPHPEEAAKVLKEAGFTVRESEVLCVEVPDRPGGLALVLSLFAKNNLSVEYMYAMVKDKIVFSLENQKEAERILREEGLKLLTQEEVSKL
jgi:hypothetical protein